MKRLFYLLSLIFVVASTSVTASTWDSYLLNRQALDQMKAKDFNGSLNHVLKALESDPLNVNLHLNLGMTLFFLGEPEKAAKAFATASQLATHAQERFTALFNEAYCLGESKQIEKALQTYQQALSLKPDSKEVKVNIELLLKGQDQKGKGDGGQGKPNKDGKPQGKDQNKNGQGDEQKKNPQPKQPKPFKSEDLTASDVKKILEELKSQEQGIRAKEYEKGPKERAHGKDW